MKTGILKTTLLLMGAGLVAMAQPPQPPQPPPAGDPQAPPAVPVMRRMGMQPAGQRRAQMGPGQMGPGMMQQGPGRGGMQPMRRAFEERLLPGPHGKWWDNPQVAEQLGLSVDQKKKMDDIFQQNRLKLVDLNATVQKAELTMEPLVAADQPDEAKIVAQIDKVAQARAELEKANARMLLGIRGVLTPEQFQKLQAQARPGGRGPMGGAMQPRRGPGPQPAKKQ